MSESTETISDDAVSPSGDLTQIGGSPPSASTLDRLEELRVIQQRRHGYQLAIAVAIGLGLKPNVGSPATARKTMFAVNALDEDTALRSTIKELYPETRGREARAMEDLAEQGLEVIANSFDGDNLSLTDLLSRVEEENAAAEITDGETGEALTD